MRAAAWAQLIVLVTAIPALAQGPAGGDPPRTTTAAAGQSEAAAPAVDASRLGVSMKRIQKGLRVSEARERRSADGLKLEYQVQVYGEAPRIDIIKDFDIGRRARSSKGAHSRQFLNHWTPQAFRSPRVPISSMAGWALVQIAKRADKSKCEREIADALAGDAGRAGAGAALLAVTRSRPPAAVRRTAAATGPRAGTGLRPGPREQAVHRLFVDRPRVVVDVEPDVPRDDVRGHFWAWARRSHDSPRGGRRRSRRWPRARDRRPAPAPRKVAADGDRRQRQQASHARLPDLAEIAQQHQALRLVGEATFVDEQAAVDLAAEDGVLDPVSAWPPSRTARAAAAAAPPSSARPEWRCGRRPRVARGRPGWADAEAAAPPARSRA